MGPGVPPAAARTPAGAARMSDKAPRLASSNDHRVANLRITLYSSTSRQHQCQKCQIQRQERARSRPVAGPLAAPRRFGLRSGRGTESESHLLVCASAGIAHPGPIRPGSAEPPRFLEISGQPWPARGWQDGCPARAPGCRGPSPTDELGGVPPIWTRASPARSLPTDANLSPSTASPRCRRAGMVGSLHQNHPCLRS